MQALCEDIGSLGSVKNAKIDNNRILINTELGRGELLDEMKPFFISYSDSVKYLPETAHT